MANKIRIDLDALSSAIKKYENLIGDFEDSLKNTENAISALKSSGWKSGASAVYFLTYERTWKKNMKKRLKIIKHLKQCLEKAQKEYREIYDEMQELDNYL